MPLTTKHHDWMDKYYVEIKNHAEFEWLKQTRWIVNQIQLIDKKRLSDKVCEKQCKEGVISYTLKKYMNFLRT